MKLLNVPPVKPGQEFKFKNGRRVYKVASIRWSHVWEAWDVSATVLVTPNGLYRRGESVNFMIYPDDVVEILND